MVDCRHSLLLYSEDIDHIPTGSLADGDHSVGMSCRGSILLAIEETVNTLVELRVAYKCQVMDRHYRPDAPSTVEPDRELIAEPMVEIHVLLRELTGHGIVAPYAPPK